MIFLWIWKKYLGFDWTNLEVWLSKDTFVAMSEVLIKFCCCTRKNGSGKIQVDAIYMMLFPTIFTSVSFYFKKVFDRF
jgi:hypothetical protein